MTRPGELVHVDIKKLGRIPDGGGHRMLGRTLGNRNNKKQGRGYAYLHHAVDGYSRLAYSEILDDERKETAAGFWNRARAFFTDAGVTVTGVMTDNGSCYRSHAFAAALGEGVKHRRTRPYRPQTNGKAERVIRTLMKMWHEKQLFDSPEHRRKELCRFVNFYNTVKPHRSLNGDTPFEVLQAYFSQPVV